jgi:hypothetical protein
MDLGDMKETQRGSLRTRMHTLAREILSGAAGEEKTMKNARIWTAVVLAILSTGFSQQRAPISATAQDAASKHHQRGVEFHLKRCLDEASQEYAATLKLDPPREATPVQIALARRFRPRLFTTATEPFRLQDFGVILHPSRPLVAYHMFWEDDIDFPEDNDPCDHELLWVEYAEDLQTITGVSTYFHGRILRGSAEAIEDARAHAGRPRFNVQWGKHGSLLLGWEKLPIVADDDDSEKKFYPVGRQITLLDYNRGTYEKLSKEGRRLQEHPLGRGWPRKFVGSWQDFTNFSISIDPAELLSSKQMIRVSRWNNATINQYFLRYNFRPKTEWPD